jgi:hypothetical protein
MPANLIERDAIIALAARAAGLDNGHGNPRLKQVVNRLLDTNNSVCAFRAGMRRSTTSA